MNLTDIRASVFIQELTRSICHCAASEVNKATVIIFLEYIKWGPKIKFLICQFSVCATVPCVWFSFPYHAQYSMRIAAYSMQAGRGWQDVQNERVLKLSLKGHCHGGKT